jgi:hypothetical protein
MNPQFEDEKAVNPFEMWAGANFKLKIRKVEGYQNYDKSEFESPSVLGGFDDDKLESIWKKEYSLKEFLLPENFKSYDELKARLDKVLGVDGSAPAPRTTVEQAKAAPKKVVMPETSDEDDDLAYFSKLADSD